MVSDREDNVKTVFNFQKHERDVVRNVWASEGRVQGLLHPVPQRRCEDRRHRQETQTSGFEKALLTKVILFRFFKLAFPGLFLFIFVLSANKQYDFYIKSMWKNVLPVSGTGIRTHGFEYMSLLHLTTWPGLPPNYIKVLP